MKLQMARMVLVAAVFIAVAAVAGYPRAAAGVVAGVPVSLFNFWLVASAVGERPGFTPKQMQAIFMRRALLRLAISMAVLLFSVAGGVEFLLGITAGLSLQMFSSVLELLWPGSRGRAVP